MIGPELLEMRIVTEEMSTIGVRFNQVVLGARGEEGEKAGAAEIRTRRPSHATDQASPGYEVIRAPTAKAKWLTLGWKVLPTAV